MKSIIQKIFRLFRGNRGKAVCAKCKHYVEAGALGNVEDGCYHANWITSGTQEKYWVPLNQLNCDGKCKLYKKR